MSRTLHRWVIPLIAIVVVPRAVVMAQGEDGFKEAVAFLATLDDTQKAEAVRPINDPERTRWTYLAGPREGVRLGSLDSKQARAFRAFLEATLSPAGLRRIDQLRKVEPVEDRGGGVRTGPDEFWVRFYGDPTALLAAEPEDGAATRAWAWRLEGHHLVLNAAIVDGRVVSISPLFFGAAPVRGGERSPEEVRGVEPLRGEDELAFALVKSLDAINRGAARSLGPTPGDIRTGTESRARDLPDVGARLAHMTAAEQALVKQIVAGYLGTWPEASRAKIMTAFNDTDPSDVRFAWSGPDVREAPHYWRIVSPVLVVEYWNGRAGANHAHAVVRTRHGEFPNG